MDKNTKWLAAVYQDYRVLKDGGLPLRATQVVQLSLRAASAQEAANKARVWLEASGIENAYVSEVCRDGIDEIDIVSVSDSV